MNGIDQYIEDNFAAFLEELRGFIRQPGISTENTGITETADWLLAKMKENGVDDAHLCETARHPIIIGTAGSGAKQTLLVYGHYDVQPPGERTEWKADPFGAEIVDGQIIGRGTCDMKNNLMASLHAVKALLETRESLPINLIFLFEGEEEIGSPSLQPFIEEHKQELAACDAIVCADGGGENKTGEAILAYGLKGMLYVELAAESPVGEEIHSMYAGSVDNPAWRLVSALNALRNDDRVLVSHFYDGTKAPGTTERIKHGLANLALGKEKMEEAFGVTFKKNMNVSQVLTETFYRPTLNINGLWSGYTVERGIKTIVPSNAWAHIDMRLMPEQDASVILQNLKDHLSRSGFGDVDVQVLGSRLPGYRIEPSERIAEVVAKATKKLNSKVTMLPLIPGSGAMAWLPHILKKPMAFAGSGATYMAHRPNEFITKEQYLKGINLFATIYSDYAS